MTDRSRTDFEPTFERRLLRHAMIEVPAVDAEAVARAATRQGRLQAARRSIRVALLPAVQPFSWRPAGRPELRFALVAVLILIAVVAVLLLTTGGSPRRTLLAVEATPAPSPTGGPLDVGLRGDWLADAGRLAELGNANPRIRLVFEPGGQAMHLETGSIGVEVMHGTIELEGEGLAVTSDRAGLGCHVGDTGRYALGRAADGVTVTLTGVADDCAARAAALERTWWRTFDAASNGGRAVAAPFSPGLVVTLPTGSSQGTAYTDAIEVTGPATAFYAIKDPWGLSDPCSPTGGSPVVLPVDLAAYQAYLEALPGFTVAATELEVDGHPAVHLAVTSDAGIDCPGGVIIEWIAKADAPSGVTWHLGPGDPDSLYLVQLPDNVFLLQFLGPSVTTEDELQVMDSIRFVDGLAGTP